MSKEIIKPVCQCEYTYEEEDVYSDYSLTGAAWINCPCCGTQNIAAILPSMRHIPSIPTWFDSDKSWRETIVEEKHNEQN